MKFIHLIIPRLVLSSFSFNRGKLVSGTHLQQMAMSLSKNNSENLKLTPQHDPDAPTDPVTKQSQWKTLETQVGGHQFGHGKYNEQKLGIFDIGSGMILKSLQNPPRGIRELNFYEKAFNRNCSDTDLLELRPFLSSYHGMEEKNKAKFLKLGNLTSGYKCPCVIDIKMGRVTYDQEATPEKVAHEVSKYPPLKTLGFQITGMMIYNPATQSNELYGKSYCKNLTEENITEDGLGKFFQLHNSELRRDVIQGLLPKLQKLEAWFLKQKKFSFVASSLLIVYEGFWSNTNKVKITGKANLPNCDQNENLNNSTCYIEASNNLPNADTHSGPITDIISATESSLSNINAHTQVNGGSDVKKVGYLEGTHSGCDASKVESFSTKDAEVCLIDFAHVFPADDIDHNFLFGLQKLIECLQSLLK